MKTTSNFPTLMQAFFTDRLMAQRNASPHTIEAYRDTFRLLLSYAQKQLGKLPSALTLEDLDSSFIGAFLDHLENTRGNSARSRNARLAGIRSFFRYLAYQVPEHSARIQRVLAMPSKKYQRAMIDFLIEKEIHALLDAPDRSTWFGRRDYTLLLTAIQTGLRVAELIGLHNDDVTLGATAYLRCLGKGRKTRCTPLTRSVASILSAWIKEQSGQPKDPLFPSRNHSALSADGVQFILAKHIAVARQQCTSLKEKRVSPHVLRHTAAMNLLHAGADTLSIALWLGHENSETVYMYVEADLSMKQKILAKTATPDGRSTRFHPDDALLSFLKNL
jgi:integrase/recombinase XerD